MVVFNGCTLLPRHTAGGSRDHTFIAYWPGPKNSQQLRLAVKDNIDMKGVVTTAGSEYVAKTSPPASRDAGCLAIARERNVHIVGKANLSEFAVSPSGINEYFGTPRSPFSKWWIRFIPGGSSSGSAAAITNRMADVAFGTDTAGSVRTPAACSGIVGLKTTFGLVPIKGVFPISPKHLDTVGPMAKDVSHLVQGMDLLQEGFAARYQAAVAARPSAKDIKIGRLYLGGPGPGSLVLGGTDPRIDKAVDNALARAGFHVVKLDEAFKAKWNKAQKDADIVAASGAWINEHEYQYKPGISARTKAVILLGGILYRTEYRKALQRQAAWQRTLRRVFQKVDFIALPTLQTLPLTISPLTDTGLLEARVLALQNTSAVNFAGNPALVIPIPVRHANVPVTSLQLVGPRLSEAELLNAVRLVESKH
jgi:Asp-tRNA(Asn)/Glu-tRNA(Gln) amidotransferase A subunit family amidase